MRRLCVGLVVVAASTLASAGSAWATTYTVTTSADSGSGSLRAAITSVDGDSSADTVNFDSGLSTITLASDLPAITQSVTINGNGNVIDGASTYRGLFVYGLGTDGKTPQNINIAINDLTIQNAKATGGSGAGGGAGLGGGLFVTDGTAVTLDNLVFNTNSAVGGGGGGDFSVQGEADSAQRRAHRPHYRWEWRRGRGGECGGRRRTDSVSTDRR